MGGAVSAVVKPCLDQEALWCLWTWNHSSRLLAAQGEDHTSNDHLSILPWGYCLLSGSVVPLCHVRAPLPQLRLANSYLSFSSKPLHVQVRTQLPCSVRVGGPGFICSFLFPSCPEELCCSKPGCPSQLDPGMVVCAWVPFLLPHPDCGSGPLTGAAFMSTHSCQHLLLLLEGLDVLS